MISFVILHYMAIEETKKCVDSILHNIKGDKQIIIVDNDSPNNSYEELNKEYGTSSEVVVLKAKENLGFAKGNNLGYKYSVEHYNSDFIVVMNNDMEIFQEDFIEKIYSSYNEYGFYILGPDVYSTKKKYHQNPQTRKMPSKSDLEKSYRKLLIKDKLKFLFPIKWWIKEKFFKDNSEIKAIADRSAETYVDKVVMNPLLHGSCFIFSKKFIEKYPEKCFYDKTFMYMEAEILYYLAQKNNELIIYYPDLKVDHHEDVATDLTFSKQYRKSIFSVECLLQSTSAFLSLIKQDTE